MKVDDLVFKKKCFFHEDIQHLAIDFTTNRFLAYNDNIFKGVSGLLGKNNENEFVFISEPKPEEQEIYSIYDPFIKGDYIYCFTVDPSSVQPALPLAIWRIIENKDNTVRNAIIIGSIGASLIIPTSVIIPIIIKKRKR